MANARSYGQADDTTRLPPGELPSGESLARLLSSSDPNLLRSNDAGLTNVHEQRFRSRSAHIAQPVRNAADAKHSYIYPPVSKTKF